MDSSDKQEAVTFVFCHGLLKFFACTNPNNENLLLTKLKIIHFEIRTIKHMNVVHTYQISAHEMKNESNDILSP